MFFALDTRKHTTLEILFYRTRVTATYLFSNLS